MVNLQGTEKQIAWAEEIRNKIASDINTVIANGESNIDKLDVAGIAIVNLARRMSNQTSASWWITNKAIVTNMRNVCNYHRGPNVKTAADIAAKLDTFCKIS